MSRLTRFITTIITLGTLIVFFRWSGYGQNVQQPTNDGANPYRTVENYFKMPEGRTWGSTSAVAVDKDGKSIWVAERCGKNSCVDDPTTGKISDLPTVMKFDASGKMVKSFGAGMFAFRTASSWITTGTSGSPTARIMRRAQREVTEAQGQREAVVVLLPAEPAQQPVVLGAAPVGWVAVLSPAINRVPQSDIRCINSVPTESF